MRLLTRILANSAAVLIIAKFVPGFVFKGTLSDLLIAGAVLGIINALVKPIVQLISLPAVFLTFGLFNGLINIAMLVLADKFLPQLTIRGFWALILGTIIISLTNHLVSSISKRGDLNKF